MANAALGRRHPSSTLAGEVPRGARIAQRNLREAVQSQRLDQMPGVRLIRKRS